MKKEIEIGSDFSGVGAFEQALKRLNIKYKNRFACDKDKFARESYLANYDAPEDYPDDVYDRKIPKKPLDLYMTSPECQGFSLAGLRKGSVLFLNSHEFIDKNRPKYFIFENVKGLLSHDKNDPDHEYGNTFNQWLYYLGGKSINGAPVIFPHEKSVPYHIYHAVLNSKDYGVPQNRERVFIVGIRDDEDNIFSFPKKEHLTKKLLDVLEDEVDEKHFLSESAINSILFNEDNLQKSKINPEIANALQCPGRSAGIYKGMTAIKINENTKKGFATAEIGDGFYVNRPHQKRGVVQKEAVPCIKTGSDLGILPKEGRIRRLTPRECFRLQDFPDSFKFVVSDTQLYKQAGNSITVAVLERIISKLNL